MNNLVTWDDKQWRLDPRTHVTTLIINILCDRNPLYRVKDFFLEQDIELLLVPVYPVKKSFYADRI